MCVKSGSIVKWFMAGNRTTLFFPPSLTCHWQRRAQTMMETCSIFTLPTLPSSFVNYKWNRFSFPPTHSIAHHTESTESCERGAIKGKNRETIESKPSTHPFSQLVENVYTSRLNGPLFKHKSFNSISFSMVIWYCWYRSGRSSQDKLLPCIFFFPLLIQSSTRHEEVKWMRQHTHSMVTAAERWWQKWDDGKKPKWNLVMSRREDRKRTRRASVV